MSNFDNPKNVIGMADILADDDEDIDIDEIEKSIITGIPQQKKEKSIDLAKEYSKEMDELGKRFNLGTRLNLGLTVGDEETAEDSRGIDDLLNFSPGSIRGNAKQGLSGLSGTANGGSTSRGGLSGTGLSGGSGLPGSGVKFGLSGNSSSPQQTYKAPYNLVDDEEEEDDTDQPADESGSTQYYPSSTSRPSWNPYKPEDEQLNRMTNEERKQNHVNKVLGTMERNNDDAPFIQKEDEEDEMASIMEQIDLIRSNLESEGVDLSRIPDVNSATSKKEARAVLRILQIKNDRLRYCDFFEEGILAVAYGMEGVFNGQREILGSKIDLTGYSDTVKVKLKRMRYDTSNFVSGIMQGYNISSGWRIMLELIPSLFLYSRNRRLTATAKDNLISDESYKKAMQDLQ